MIGLAFQKKRLIVGDKYESIINYKGKQIKMEMYFKENKITTSYIIEIL